MSQALCVGRAMFGSQHLEPELVNKYSDRKSPSVTDAALLWVKPCHFISTCNCSFMSALQHRDMRRIPTKPVDLTI